jgi:hypothetical protein
MTSNSIRFYTQLQQLIAGGFTYRVRLPVNDAVWLPLPSNNHIKLLIIYDKPPHKNSEPEVETYYKTYEVQTYNDLVPEFYCQESCTSHYFGSDNPKYMSFVDDVLCSSDELENFRET